MLSRKDLLGLIDVSASEITEILDLAQEFKNRIKKGEKKISYLQNKTATWTIVAMHNPMYSAGRYGSDSYVVPVAGLEPARFPVAF